MLQVKSLEEHKEYVERFCRISFFTAKKYFADKLPEESLGTVIKKHTPILYHGLTYLPAVWEEDEECAQILAKAENLASLSAEEFEEAMWEYLKPLAHARAEKFYPDSVGVKRPPSWNCGSLKYDDPVLENFDGYVNFHIANAVGPHSIFEDRSYMAYCFMLLMREARLRFNAVGLKTSTWLNERNSFLAFFPQEYKDNLSVRPEMPAVPAWHFGWWGQLVTSRGTIHPEAERFVREKGYLRYAPRASRCSFEAMEKHLKENFL